MRVNIVCSEAESGWIYSEFIKQLKKYSKHEILVNEMDEDKYDIIYWLPYYEVQKTNKPSVCWLSHMEEKNPLRDKFVQAARMVDVGFSHSKKYANVLRNNYQCNNVFSTIPGVDIKKFRLRSGKRPDNNKMVVGHVGRRYSSSNRKNPTLIEKIGKLPFIKIRATDGKLKSNQIPKFIRECDIIIQPSLIEGGSMAVQESLACGVPIVVFENVGVADEFNEGVIKAKNELDFVAKIKDLYLSKQYLTYWRKPEIMNKMRQQVEGQSWERWVRDQDKIFDMIVIPSWRKSGE